MLFMGICGICYEYVLGALGNYLMGSTQEQIYVIIGIMMFAMGIGAIFQKLFERALLEKFLLLEILLGFLGGISCTLVHLAHSYSRSYLLVLWGFAFLIGLLIGLEIPILIRVNKKYSARLKDNLSLILSLDYVGSLFGALLFTYVLLKSFSLNRISLLLGMVNTSIALTSLFYFRKEVQHPKLILICAILGLTVLFSLFTLSEDLQQHLEQQFFRDPIIASITTPYQHLTLTQYQNRLSLYINGHLQFSSSDEHIYHEVFVHPAMMAFSTPKNILILGGGDGLALREVLKYKSVQKVDLVDIDPAITDLASTHPLLTALNQGSLKNARVFRHLPEALQSLKQQEDVFVYNQNSLNPWDTQKFPIGENVTLFHLDADLFIQEVQKNQYDVILLDFPDPHSVETAKLYSIEFYQQMRNLLNPGGIVAIQSGSPYFTQKAFACIGKTLNQAGFETLPYHTYLPSLGNWGFYLAWDAKRHPREVPQTLFQKKIEVPTRFLNETTLRAIFCFGKEILLDPNEVQTNSKLRVLLPEYYRETLR